MIPERFKGKGRWSLIVGALLATLTLGAVMAFASGFGATTALASGSTTSIPLNNATADQGEDCPDDPGAYWHFVTSPNGGGAAFVEFHLNLGDADTYDTSDFIQNGGQDDNVFVQVPDGKSLDDLIKDGSTADITGSASKFQLSHVCDSGPAESNVLTEVRDGDGNDVTGSSVALGSVVHDHAKVEAPDSPDTPEGTVDFTFYKGTAEAPCSGDAVTTENGVALDNGEADSADSAALAAGSYGYIVSYHSGDADKWTDDTGDCEPFTVNKAQLTIVTQIHDAAHNNVGGSTSVALGSVVHDTATVTGKVDGFDPTGTISFTLNGGAVVNADPAETGFTASTVDSDPLGAGSYTYAASVADDSNYIGDLSDDEPLTVDKGDLNIATLIHDSADNNVTFVPVGGIVHDTAQLTGATPGFDPTPGNVSFVFYMTNDCTGDSVSQDNIGADAKTGDPRSEAVGPLASGAYSFQASYANDANYNDAGPGDCEPLSVRTYGKTMGYWGNKNGQLRIPTGFSYVLGSMWSNTCYILVNKAKTATILPNTKNGVSILTNCTTVASRDPGINTDSLNTLLAQSLALALNIAYVNGFDGQTLGAFGPAVIAAIPTAFPAGQSLTAASTVQQTLDYANYLIAQSKLGGVAITQPMIGQLNTLLGLINAEA